ncbi:MAG: ATP-binding protein [bacterium]
MLKQEDEKNSLFSLLKEIIPHIQLPIALLDNNKKLILSNDLYTDYLSENFERYFQSKKDSEKKGIQILPVELDNEFSGFLLIANKNPLLETEQKIFAHDLSNYLSNALNSFDLLQHNLGDEQIRENMIESVDINLRKAIELAVQYLSPEGTVKKKSIINPVHIINDTVKSFNHIVTNEISLKTIINESINKIFANFSDLNRVLTNLFTNSKESIAGKGEITIKAGNVSKKFNNDENTVEYVFISINDTGSGINEENLKKLFDEEFSTKEKGRISGIGLRAVKKIITDHKGFIEVKSKLNEGSEFTIYLPAVLPVEKSSIKRESQTLLLGEDEQELQEVLGEMFKSYGYNVISASSGTELLNIISENNQIDLFIIDNNIPGVDGLKCIKILRKMGFAQPIILATGTYQEQSQQEFEILNIAKVINKPYLFEELLKEVQTLFGG